MAKSKLSKFNIYYEMDKTTYQVKRDIKKRTIYK